MQESSTRFTLQIGRKLYFHFKNIFHYFIFLLDGLVQHIYVHSSWDFKDSCLLVFIKLREGNDGDKRSPEKNWEKDIFLRFKVLSNTVIFDERAVLVEHCIYRIKKTNAQEIGNFSCRGLWKQKIRKEWKKVYWK